MSICPNCQKDTIICDCPTFATSNDLPKVKIPEQEYIPSKMWMLVCASPLHPKNAEQFALYNGHNLSTNWAPKFVHHSEDEAVTEALRLSESTGHQFIVLESIGYTNSVPLNDSKIHRFIEQPTPLRPALLHTPRKHRRNQQLTRR